MTGLVYDRNGVQKVQAFPKPCKKHRVGPLTQLKQLKQPPSGPRDPSRPTTCLASLYITINSSHCDTVLAFPMYSKAGRIRSFNTESPLRFHQLVNTLPQRFSSKYWASAAARASLAVSQQSLFPLAHNSSTLPPTSEHTPATLLSQVLGTCRGTCLTCSLLPQQSSVSACTQHLYASAYW